jgi:hypothetical protein
LKLGKRVFACSGDDGHSDATTNALTVIYAEEKKSASYIRRLREGDFVCGSVGIRMMVGDVRMGGSCDFAGKRLCVAVDDFHASVKNPDHAYRVDILDGNRVVFSEKISCDEPSYFSLDTQNTSFYRVEVFDDTEGIRIAIGNPIWNDGKG